MRSSNRHLFLCFRITTKRGQSGWFTVCPVCQQPWTLPLLSSLTKHSPSNLQERPWPKGARGWPPHGTSSFFFSPYFLTRTLFTMVLNYDTKRQTLKGRKKRETFPFQSLFVQDLHKGCLCFCLTHRWAATAPTMTMTKKFEGGAKTLMKCQKWRKTRTSMEPTPELYQRLNNRVYTLDHLTHLIVWLQLRSKKNISWLIWIPTEAFYVTVRLF